MYTDDQFGRSFCIGWVQAMHKVPSPTITKHLPEIIDPLFTFLTDSRSEIYVRCQTELEKFLGFIKNDPPSHEAFTLMVNNLVVHVQSDHIRPQTMSVHWIRAFAEISGQSLFPYISGILAAILPNLSYEEEKRRSVSEHEYKSKMNCSFFYFVSFCSLVLHPSLPFFPEHFFLFGQMSFIVFFFLIH